MYLTEAQMKNAQERNKPMATPATTSAPKPKPTIVNPTQEPIQQTFDFSERFDEISDKELDKDVVSILKLLSKFGCDTIAVNHIMTIIKGFCPNVKYHQKDPKAKD